MFDNLFCEIGLRKGVMCLARVGSLICHLEHGEDGLDLEATA